MNRKSPWQGATPSPADGDGVRVIRRAPTDRRWRVLGWLAFALLAGVALGLLARRPGQPPVAPTHAAAKQVSGVETRVAAPVPSAAVPKRRLPVSEPTERAEDFELPSLDPDDLAAYVRPGDEEPTAAELIEALREAGIESGLAAFNHPGTSPPLEGLAVPEDYELPEGYVRHHQVTDEGEPIEAILMFSPDLELRDESGALIELPADLVVPEALAPPGLPIRRVSLPPPP
ncbi:hypothetical protein [Pseudomarimonas salicorniae]|uniref:Secreted protein n=1 Tax=Pseudomarimonas salicorniae TaxID=2933270 RepID=A0ABT0GER2_9GAMM|nr:hypothetical protein [Lysobacter sp. CAU 1642]MCK7593035.1 hypothetical protein [Lysobacter sp. CAU 1642]